MGTEICTCLNNLMDMDSEDLSREQNENTDNNNTKKKVNKKPKVVLNRKDSLDSENPFQSGREKDSISTNINSEYKNTLTNHNQQTQREQTNKQKQNIKNKNNNNNNNNRNNNSNNNITNSNNNLTNKKTINNNSSNNTSNNNINRNSKNNNIKKEEKIKKPSIDFDKILNRDQMVSENFNKFFNSQQGQEMILNMDDAKNKICVTLHKYFVSLITRRKYKKNLKYFQEEKKSLFQKCLDIIYNSNPNLQKLEKMSPLKYTSDGYMKYYPEQKDQEKMKFDPQKESFDNCILINYEEDDSSSLDKMLWIYSGQVNKIGLPHGLGEKIFKNGIKQKGYWKSGEMCGWGMILDAYGTIFMGPFFDGKGVTGLGEKFSLRKKAYYKGEFMDGEKSGKGEEDSNEGYFVGNYYHDKKNGKGKMKYKLSGDEYEGDYKNDLFDGQGHYIWKMTGQQYTGDYKAGMMHGKGLFEYSEGEYYKGDFVNGKKEGEGELHMGNGRSYIGPFVNGRPNGIGIFDNGINFKGEVEFAEGKMDINFIKKKYIDKDNKNIDNEEDNKENKDINEIKEVKEING